MQENCYSISELRRVNRNRVYRCLYEMPEPKTARDLAGMLTMSMPTLSQNLNELLDLGLIDNSEMANSSGGRKPRILSIVPAARYAVGAEISPHRIRMVAVDLTAAELGYQSVQRQFDLGDDYACGLAHDIEVFINKLGLERDKLLGVGITLPGIINAEQRLLESAPTLKIRQQSIDVLARHIPYKVSFYNDANAGGFAEWRNRSDMASMAYLSLGRGVGGAVLINGMPYEGMRQRSGEFGHMCIHPGGKMCSCGKQGCLEAYCSTAVLSNDLGITLDEFFGSVAAGDELNIDRWNCYLDNLAIGIVNIRMVIDCDIVLGGPLSQYLREHMGTLENRIRQLDPNGGMVDYIHLCRYHGKSNGVGAALQFVDAFIAEI